MITKTNTKIAIKFLGKTFFTYEKDVTSDATNVQLKPVDTQKPAPPPNYMGEVKPDLKELEIQAGLSTPPIEHKKIDCSTCNGTTYEIDIKSCNTCGKEICSNCGSYDDMTKQNLCEKCWEEI